ncbi:MAG: FHA domain-containing protein [Verrucomicrobiota bacterium]
MACLVYYDDQGNATRLPLGKATLMLGSADDSQILLKDNSVSKNHASIVFDKNKFWVRDNGSTNGSLVNGQPAQYQQLQNGDILQFGSYKFFFDEFYQTNVQLEKTFSQDVKLLNPVASQRKGQNYRQTVHLQSKAVNAKGSIQMMLTEGVTHTPDSLCKASMICGCLGPVAFLPAIVIGHAATPKSEADKKNQTIGLSLGYTFLFVWALVAIYFVNQPKASATTASADNTEMTTALARLEYPILTNPLDLVKNSMVWLPPKGIYKHILFDEPNAAIEGNANLQKEVSALKSVFLHGLVWTELGSAAFKLQPSQRKLRLVYETYRTNPTFWEYNSTMVPEKKCYYDPFLFPDETPQFFYDYDRGIIPPLPRFAGSVFRWCFGVRGLTFNLPPNYNPQESLANLRVILIVRPGDKPSTLKIETLEGNLTRDEQKSYEYKIVPSTLYAAIVYRITDRKPVIVSTYEKYFSLEDTKAFETWVDKNLEEVISHQPNSSLAISEPFTVKDKAAAAEAAKPKVSFVVEPAK